MGALPASEYGKSSMDNRQFRSWAALLEERTGMVLPEERRSFLVTGVGLRMREVGFADFDAYYDYLASGRAGRIEWAALVDHLTVQETRFFRDPKAIRLIEEHFLPQAVARVSAGEAVQVWSAGCATGEEAYTLAMMLDQHLSDAGLPRYYGVTGSDISLQALSIARHGRYSNRRLASVPSDYASLYCQSVSSVRFEMSESLRRRSCFTQLNLLDDVAAALPGMDLVYCQNVLIYFDQARRTRILTNLVDRLRPGGIMILGPGEAMGWSAPGVERIGGPNVLAFKRLEAEEGVVRP
jgi:chemotaxis protein methyltransferase CheR/type IV pilus assembly protein PilK